MATLDKAQWHSPTSTCLDLAAVDLQLLPSWTSEAKLLIWSMAFPGPVGPELYCWAAFLFKREMNLPQAQVPIPDKIPETQKPEPHQNAKTWHSRLGWLYLAGSSELPGAEASKVMAGLMYAILFLVIK